MKTAILIHGMSGSLDISFGQKLKEDLKNNGYNIIEPLYTTKNQITLDSWFSETNKIKNTLKAADVIICYSLGTNFIVKYLVKNNISCNLVIAVAGGVATARMGEKFDYLEPFIPSKEEFKKFRQLVSHVYNIYSNNDHIWKQEHIHLYSELTGATEIFLKNKGHFGATSGVKEIPELIEIIKKYD